MRVAERTGSVAVAMIAKKLTPEKILTAHALENALRVLLAIGGSTNGLIHLTALAGRLGIAIDLDALDAMSRETPVLVDLKPSGQHYMEDFHAAGGLPAVLRELRPLLHLGTLTVTGRTLGEELDAATATTVGAGLPRDPSGHKAPPPEKLPVIRSRAQPIYAEGGIAVLRGNLAPGGAIIKQSAATPALLEHEGRAIVFENAEDLARRIDDLALDVNANDVLILKRIGPVGAPGMPEAGYIPIPKKLASQGVKDMVRISDGRMSGTAAGTLVLHVTPEAAIGGPLAAARTGDRVRLSVAKRSLSLLVSDEEIAQRLAVAASASEWQPTTERGYLKLFLDHVTQADRGCDFDFLRTVEMTHSIPARRA